MTSRYISQIYLGDRGDAFKKLISGLLEMGNVSKKYRNELLTKEALVYFGSAFTEPTADPNNNYQVLELIGDLLLNKCIVNYLLERFPQLFNCGATDILTKLKITIIQSKYFATLAEDLNFWHFISCDEDLRKSSVSKTKILEDVFESIFGAIEFFLDHKYRPGVGFGVVFQIVTKLMDKKEISLAYKDLVDSKTRLKELFDSLYVRNGTKIQYVHDNTNQMLGQDKVYSVRIIQSFPDGKTRVIGQGSNVVKVDAEKQAAQHALDLLEKENIFKTIPIEYKQFCT
jgi:dsRNA-specific ribonuclease